MKKITIIFGIILAFLGGSCEDYGDDFNKLNDRIDSLESQIAGFSDLSSGLTALDTKVGSLSTAVDAIPDNNGFSSSVTAIHEQIDALQEALAELISGASSDSIDAIDGLSGTLQEQVDALNDQLAAINADLKTLLNANNVYPGDMIILNEGALEAAIAWVENRETLIIDGAFVIDGDWADGIMSGKFDIERSNLVTSKIVAILGRDFTTGYVEVQDWDGDVYYDDGDVDWVDLYAQSVFQEVGTTVWAGEIDSMQGNGENDMDFSNLVTIRGAFEINEVYDAGVDMSSLQRQIGGNREYAEYEIVNYESMYAVSDFNGNGLDYDIQEHQLSFEEVEGEINLSSLISAEQLYFYESGAVNLASLISVYDDLYTRMTGVVTAPMLKTVGDDLVLDYGGGYDFPELKYVDDNLRMVDYGTDNDYGAATTKINFPMLSYVGDMIEVLNEYYDGDTDNEFSNATYVNILGYFSEDFDYDGDQYGFGAPLATTVIVNGDTYYEEGDSYIMSDLFVDAPLADVTLTFTHTDNDYADGTLAVDFKTLTAANLSYVDGDLYLYGPEWEEVPLENIVTLPELVTIDGDDDPIFNVYNVYELIMPKYDGDNNTRYMSDDLLRKFTAASIDDDYVDFGNLESLTLTALDRVLDLNDLENGYEYGVSYETLTELNITGADCSASVIVGVNGDYDTDYDVLETITLAGTFSSVEIVGAGGLTTINTSGEISSWDFVNNDAVTTYNVNHTPGTCIN